MQVLRNMVRETTVWFAYYKDELDNLFDNKKVPSSTLSWPHNVNGELEMELLFKLPCH